MNDVFCFAQLSDPHLSDLSSVRARQLLSKRLLGYLSWRRRRQHEHRGEVLQALAEDLRQLAPDHTVVTGDLTHISLPHEFVEARDWLESLGEGHDITAVPGNHDAYVRVNWDKGQGLWEAFMRGDNDNLGGPGLFPAVRRRGPLTFIGTSSAVPVGPLFAKGTLGNQQRQRLRDVLKSLQDDQSYRGLLIHHPPVPGQEKWRKRLTDAPELCELLQEYPVDLVLHGHRHRAQQLTIPGTQIPVFGIPSSSSAGILAPNPAEYNVYRFERSAKGWRVTVSARRYVGPGKPFIEHQLAEFDAALI